MSMQSKSMSIATCRSDNLRPAERHQRPAAASTGPSTASTGPSADADAKVDLSALREASGSGSVRIAHLKVRGVEAADVRLAAKASDGRIDVAPVSARIYGGNVTGRIGIDTRTNSVSATGNATGVQLRSARRQDWRARRTRRKCQRHLRADDLWCNLEADETRSGRQRGARCAQRRFGRHRSQ